MSQSLYESSREISQFGFSHALIHFDFKNVPLINWQVLNFMRWMPFHIKIIAALASVQMYPSNEIRTLIRQIGKIADVIIVNETQQVKNLIYTYYINPSKILNFKLIEAHNLFDSSFIIEPLNELSERSYSKQASWIGNKVTSFNEQVILDVSEFAKRHMLYLEIFTSISHDPLVSFFNTKDTYVLVLFTDNDIQVNVALSKDFTIIAIGVLIPQGWIYGHKHFGLDYELRPDFINGFKKDFTKHESIFGTLEIYIDRGVAVIHSLNFITRIQIETDDYVNVVIKSKNMYACPVGILGDTFRPFQEISQFSLLRCDDWSPWIIPDGYLFSVQSKSQSFKANNMHGNVYDIPESHDLLRGHFQHYPEYVPAERDNWIFPKSIPVISRYSKSPTSAITPVIYVQMEGQFIANEGFAAVSRQLWLQLQTYYSKFVVKVVINEVVRNIYFPEPHCLLVILVYHASQLPWMTPLKESNSLIVNKNLADYGTEHFIKLFDDFYYESLSIGEKEAPMIIFRNGWIGHDPNFRLPPFSKAKIIQSLPWEFYALPKSWIRPLNDNTDVILLPSTYCKSAFIANNIDPSIIKVLHHGVPFYKFRQIQSAYSLPTKKRLKMLLSGGLLKRKGIDIAIQAYLKAFTRDDDVVLIVHSVYGSFMKKEITNYIRDYERATFDPSLIKLNPSRYNIPQIIFLYHNLGFIEKATLYTICDLFLACYRSEGFGLMILESLALGKPVIIPAHGPAIDFASEKSSFYINPSPVADCVDYPCGPLSILKKPTLIQPQWNEPSTESLIEILTLIHQNPKILQEKTAAAVEDAAKLDWNVIGSEFIELLVELAFNPNPPRRFTHSQYF